MKIKEKKIELKEKTKTVTIKQVWNNVLSAIKQAVNWLWNHGKRTACWLWTHLKQAGIWVWNYSKLAGKWLWKNKKRKLATISCLILICLVLSYFGGVALRAEIIYNNGVELYNEKSYAAAAEHFDKIADYKNAENYQYLCRQHLDYEKAQELLDNGAYESAQVLFASLGDFEDAQVRAEQCGKFMVYDQAQVLMEFGAYNKARALFESLGDFEDAVALEKLCGYEHAQELFDNGELEEAYKIFKDLGSYKNSSKKAASCLHYFYVNQGITMVDQRALQNSVYSEYYDMITAPVYGQESDSYVNEYPISDGRTILTNFQTGHLYLREKSGATTLLLKGYREFDDMSGIEDKVISFMGMVDDHRFFYDVGGWEWQWAFGIYDISTGADHRYKNSPINGYAGWSLQKIDGDRALFGYFSEFQLTQIGELDLNSYQFKKIDLAPIRMQADNLDFCFDISSDNQNAIFASQKGESWQIYAFSLREQKILQTYTILDIPRSSSIKIVYKTDKQIYAFFRYLDDGCLFIINVQ